jgi:hypothetical protein
VLAGQARRLSPSGDWGGDLVATDRAGASSSPPSDPGDERKRGWAALRPEVTSRTAASYDP